MQVLWEKRELIWAFLKRDLLTRYKGSVLGFLWSFLNPLFLLLLYTFVFSVLLGIRFPGSQTIAGYGLYLFCGLIPWIAFSETISRSPSLIPAQANLVKRVIFPTEILPLVAAASGFVHSLCALVILIGAVILLKGQFFHLSILLLPLVIVPQLLLTIGLSWLLASLGVFFRDLSEIMRIVVTAWTFLTPIMYPIEMIPESYRVYMFLNPMTAIVEGYRDLILKGSIPHWEGLAWTGLLGLLTALIGYFWFSRTKREFADVI
jgi:lipopolysaccharide transport system permease protein